MQGTPSSKHYDFNYDRFQKYFIDNYDKLEDKFIKLIKEKIKPDDFNYTVSIAKNKGKIDKSLLGYRVVKIEIFNSCVLFGYTPVGFDEWKEKYLNDEILAGVRAIAEKEL